MELWFKVTTMAAYMKWEFIETTGTRPTVKNHTATLCGDRLYVFGGYNGRQNYGSLHCLDTLSWAW